MSSPDGASPARFAAGGGVTIRTVLGSLSKHEARKEMDEMKLVDSNERRSSSYSNVALDTRHSASAEILIIHG
jgi:hypothetical protein